jgi:predicted RNase H-like nuclease (RuvC/YqgF family)
MEVSMFLDKKEIEALENTLVDKDREIERLRKENNELRSQMEGEHPVSPYCTVCAHGINE